MVKIKGINFNPMEKLLNDQLLKKQVFNQRNLSNEDVLVAMPEVELVSEVEIGNGNLQDYLEIYGELDDN